MKKLFGQFDLSWKFDIIFAIVLGIVVGILNRIPILSNTSFQDIAIYYDMWIIIAIFVIVNCKNLKDAILKCFIFFLISQPIIYLSEIIIDFIIYNKNFTDLLVLYFKNYYFGAGWFYMTLLTIPGTIIAYQIKKNNILSVLILSVATSYLAFTGSSLLLNTIFNGFPYHLINSIICLFMAFYLIILIIQNKKEKIIGILITFLALVVGILYYFYINSKPKYIYQTVDFPENIFMQDYSIENPNIVNVTFDKDSDFMAIITGIEFGKTKVTLTSKDNQIFIYEVNSTKKGLEIKLLGKQDEK